MPVIIEFSRCIGTYSSAKFELITIDVLSEGYNLVNLNTVILMTGTHSDIRLRQRIGRVVRKPRSMNKKARVIWYYYANKDNLSDKIGFYTTLKDNKYSGYDLKHIQSEKEKNADRDRQTYYLTAPEYSKELDYLNTYDINKCKEIYYLLDILGLFRVNKKMKDCVGCYIWGDENEPTVIYVDNTLKKGFQQLQRRIHCEYLSLRHSNNDVKDVNEFISRLGKGREEYISDIMKMCFFLCRPSKTSFFYVTEDMIEKFIEYLLRNNCVEPRFMNELIVLYKYVNDKLKTEDSKYRKTLEEDGKDAAVGEIINNLKQEDKYLYDSLNCYGDEDDEVRKEIIQVEVEKIIQDFLDRNIENIEGSNENTQFNVNKKQSDLTQESNIEPLGIAIENFGKMKNSDYNCNLQSKIEKRHDFLLRVNSFIDHELDSIKDAISSGYNWSDKLVQCKYNGDKQCAFVSLTYSDKDNMMTCVRNKEFDEDIQAVYFEGLDSITTVAMCQSLIKNKHHLVITEEDVSELKKGLIDLIKKNSIEIIDDEDNLVKDVICKLGCSDSYIKALIQCLKKASIRIPRFIIYLIYDEIYEELLPVQSYGRSDLKVVSFLDKDNNLSDKCTNEPELVIECIKILKDFGLEKEDFEGLNPVEDIIIDYRPYIKTLRYYQGIKPDLLCRMMNFIINQEPKIERFISGCGGSGADLFNRFGRTKIKEEIYNEYGYLLTNFYLVLQEEKEVNKLKKKVKDLVDYIKKGEGSKSFLRCPVYCGKQSDIARGETYRNSHNKDEKDEDRKKIETLFKSENYYKFFMDKSENDETKARENMVSYIQTRENILHGVWESCKEIYNKCRELSDEKINALGIGDIDLALVVFLYWSFNDRYAFDGCHISRFIEFAAEYEKLLDLGHKRFKNVNIYKNSPRDVKEVLIQKDYNNSQSIAYCDIPYSETDASSYVSESFDFEKFASVLVKFKGKYIVSSRYNICTTPLFKKMYYDEPKSTNFFDDYEKEVKRNYYFEAEEDIPGNIKKMIEEGELKKEEAKDGKICVILDDWIDKRIKSIYNFYLDLGEKSKAKYVVMPYTAKEEIIQENNKVLLHHNNFRLILDDVNAMFKRTVFSNIPVEVMITNVEFKEKTQERKLMEAYKLDKDIFAVPTINAVNSGSYLAEPIYLVIGYEKYLSLLKQQLFYKEDTKKTVDFLREYYS